MPARFEVEEVTGGDIGRGDEIIVDGLRRKVWSVGPGEYASSVRFDLGDRRQEFEARQPVLRVLPRPAAVADSPVTRDTSS